MHKPSRWCKKIPVLTSPIVFSWKKKQKENIDSALEVLHFLEIANETQSFDAEQLKSCMIPWTNVLAVGCPTISWPEYFHRG